MYRLQQLLDQARETASEKEKTQHQVHMAQHYLPSLLMPSLLTECRGAHYYSTPTKDANKDITRDYNRDICCSGYNKGNIYHYSLLSSCSSCQTKQEETKQAFLEIFVRALFFSFFI